MGASPGERETTSTNAANADLEVSSGAASPSAAESRTFLQLSAVLTGFDPATLQGTGVVDSHCALIRQVVGGEFFARFIAVANGALGRRAAAARERAIRTELVEAPTFGPLVSNLIALWYLGQWNAMPNDWFSQNELASPTNVTPVPTEAYIEALAYRVAGAHPPGANPPGHGSWSIPPLLRDDASPSHTPKTLQKT